MKRIQIELYNIREKLTRVYQIDEFSDEDYIQIIDSLNKALALCDVSRSLATNTDYLSAAKDTLFDEHQNRLKKQVKR